MLIVDPNQHMYRVKGLSQPPGEASEPMLPAIPTPLNISSKLDLKLTKKTTVLAHALFSVRKLPVSRHSQKVTDTDRLASTPSSSHEASESQESRKSSLHKHHPLANFANDLAISRITFESNRPKDELDEIMDSLKEPGDLPIDEDSDAAVEIKRTILCEVDEGGDSFEVLRPAIIGRKIADGQIDPYGGFQCMQKHEAEVSDKNPNARTIEILGKMADHYAKMHDQWRANSYRKGISVLKKQSNKVTTAKEAVKLPFIGQRLADKIEEIVRTDSLRRLEATKEDQIDKSLSLFMGIYGVGISTATQWVERGYRTLAELESHVALTKNQKVGLERYDDFNTRIPREEVRGHSEIVRAAVQKIDPEIQVHTMGSYRRGAKDCGDIDLILTKENASSHDLQPILQELVAFLKGRDFLQATLASNDGPGSDGMKWHGASRLPICAHTPNPSPLWRRLDILLVPWAELGAAMIYFTGNDIFNRSIRLLASKKGMRLNQKGLFTAVPARVQGGGVEVANARMILKGTLLEAADEKKIFEHLGVPWRPPEHRVC
jgi:DNA polymerase IV